MYVSSLAFALYRFCQCIHTIRNSGILKRASGSGTQARSQHHKGTTIPRICADRVVGTVLRIRQQSLGNFTKQPLGKPRTGLCACFEPGVT